MILFLPPAPHTGDFFESIRNYLDRPTSAATYPGYGDVPKTEVSIEAYASSLLPQVDGTTLVGFHTGCLVALEMVLQASNLGSLVLVDMPYFDAATKAKHAAGLDPDNPAHDAFRAAFAYDLDTTLNSISHPVICVATESNLFEATRKAAAKIRNSKLIERRDISKPVFEGDAMATLIRDLTT